MTFLIRFLGILILSLGLNAVSFAKDPQICSANADKIVQWAVLRDNGLPKQVLVDTFDFSQVPEEYRRQMKQDVLREVEILYKSTKTPLEDAKEYFFRCLKQPEYQSEKQI